MSAPAGTPTATFQFDLRSSMQHLPSADLRPSPFPCSFPILSFIIIIIIASLALLLFRFVPLRPSSASDIFLWYFFDSRWVRMVRCVPRPRRRGNLFPHRHRVIAHRNRISSSCYIFVRKYLWYLYLLRQFVVSRICLNFSKYACELCANQPRSANIITVSVLSLNSWNGFCRES